MADHVQPQYPVQESDPFHHFLAQEQNGYPVQESNPFHHFIAQEQNGSLTEPNLYYEVHSTEEDEGEVFELNSVVIVTSVTPYQELEPFVQPVTHAEAEEPLTDAEAVGIKLKENSITLATEPINKSILKVKDKNAAEWNSANCLTINILDFASLLMEMWQTLEATLPRFSIKYVYKDRKHCHPANQMFSQTYEVATMDQ